ncbi:Nuclear control of ATPase protein 2 [Microsporum canis]
MSLIGDHVRRLDSYVDRLQLAGLADVRVEATQRRIETRTGNNTRKKKKEKTQETLESVHSPLVAAARALSGGHTLKPARVLDHLRRVHSLQPTIRAAVEVNEREDDDDEEDDDYDGEGGDYDDDALSDGYTTSLLWLVASKAAVQTFASVMTSMVDETVPLSDGIWYWDEVLGSAFYSGLYTLQTAPARWASYLAGIYQAIRQTRAAEGVDGTTVTTNSSSPTLMARWRAFYRLVHRGARARSVSHAKQFVLSPFQLARARARTSRRGLRKLREMTACAVGLLMEEGLLFDVEDDDTASIPVTNTAAAATSSSASKKENPDEWRDIVSRTTLLMQTVLQHVNDLDTDLAGFEDNVFSTVERGIEAMEDSFALEGAGTAGRTANPTDQAYQVIQQLIDVLEYHLPHQHEQSGLLAREYARPSRLTRYWPAALTLLLSSSTILNILTNRRAEMLTWLRELVSTASDFWTNWIIQPLTRLVGTIRHDEKSEVALMSKNSLDADFSSLERMVVDFVRNRPAQNIGAPHGDTPDALDLIRQGVRQGDLTPVLRAYERDLQRPFIGAIRGDLVTALLIQIQKTKVDVEVAISGINSILKSQELVFAFIGLTPSILISYSAVQWAASLLGSRRGLLQGQRRGAIVRSLRTVNRILMASPSQTGVLSYKDHGLLLCEAETLRRRAERVLPGVIYHEFHEDLNDLLNVRSGVARQMKVVDQIRWTYSKWLSA